MLKLVALFSVLCILPPVLPVNAAQLGNIITPTHTEDLNRVARHIPSIESFNAATELQKLTVNRPTIGLGKLNILLFVDFNEKASLRALRNVINIVRKSDALKLTIVYYAPSRPSSDQVAAKFSMIVYRVTSAKKHLHYLEQMINTYGTSSNSITKSAIKAHIAPKQLLTAMNKDSAEANRIIEENNVVGYAITRIVKAPILVIDNKIIYGYLGEKYIKRAISEIVKPKNGLQRTRYLRP